MSAPGTRPARRPHRTATRRRRPVTAGAAAVLLAVLGACASGDEGAPTAESTVSPTPSRSAATPSATATPSPTSTVTPTPDTTPGPATSPAPAAGDGAGAGSGTASGVQLRSGGRVGDLPAEAPEAQAVPYLTDLFGSEPTVEDPSSACGYDVGRRIRWGDLTVFVRSVDEMGAPVDPYVAAWAVGEPSSSLATVEGLRVGDPESRIAQLYPGAVGGEDEHSHGHLWWNVQAADGGAYAFITEAGTVTRLSSGAVCGD